MKRSFKTKKNFGIFLGINILITIIMALVMPEFLERHIARMVGIGLAIILIELPICFMILIEDKESDK